MAEDKRPRTLAELRALRRGALAILADEHPDVASYLEIVEECLTRLEDQNPLHRASASFRQATSDLEEARHEAVTKPISSTTQEALRKRATPGYGFEAPPSPHPKKKDHD
jgi:hypothetical protein